MANLLDRRPKTQFWQLNYQKPDGTWSSKTTGLRIDSVSDTRRAKAMEAQHSLEEAQRRISGGRNGKWVEWVPRTIAQKWPGKSHEKTRSRYELMWRNWAIYLEKKNIQNPRQLSADAILNFVEWRKKPDEDDAVYKVGQNTARMEVKFMHQLLKQAIPLGFLDRSPIPDLSIGKEAAEEKRELDDDELRFLLKILPSEPEWMLPSFMLGLHQALRITQTQFPIRGIDFQRNTITYPGIVVKGKKAFSHTLSPAVRGLAQKMTGPNTIVLPKMASLIWWKFLKKKGLKDACFHCLRVTWVTRAARADINMQVAMAFVNHGDTLVHKIYTKLKVSDSQIVHQRVALPSLENSQLSESQDALPAIPKNDLPLSGFQI